MEVIEEHQNHHTPSSTKTPFDAAFVQPIRQKEWMNIIHKCLTYLSGKDVPTNVGLYQDERQILPASFFDGKGPLQYCYCFKGQFLPSGNLDGRVWKPSQGARPSGEGLMKRYFYYKEANIKIKRQVIWLTDNEDWCFLDYRCNFKGKISIPEVWTPEGFDFGLLLQLSQGISPTIEPIPETSEKKRKLKKEKEEIVPAIIQEEEQIISDVIPLGSETVHLADIGYPNLDLSLYDPSLFNTSEINQFDCDFSSDPIDALPIYQLDDLNEFDMDMEELLDEGTIIKRRKMEDLPIIDGSMMSIPSPSLYSYAFGNFSFSTPIDFLINRLLSYDQILDTLCQNICTQLIFNRDYFRRSGQDSSALLHAMVQRCSLMNVDMMEFPGNLLSNFFSWLLECVGVKPQKLPPVYCLVCGKCDKKHDHEAHRSFSDQPFALRMKEQARNFYDLVKELISFLLRNPNLRSSVQEFVMEHVHCPFCGMKHGQHCNEKHKKWQQIYSIFPTEDSENQLPMGNPIISDNATYAQVAFDYIMEKMPFTIPSFLLSMNNVQTFLEPLVALWKSIRLL
eukprot:TRINITY_DN6087_c2_g1_i1.p1 TRINITY_DN6087_c2_g1~~TRINITY_DN6087_c2_g1_i1.p1  ORF type:complete len:564 (+),score=157.14 TRINITY_DN6087_c2_g1_i1:38-1729(+)